MRPWLKESSETVYHYLIFSNNDYARVCHSFRLRVRYKLITVHYYKNVLKKAGFGFDLGSDFSVIKKPGIRHHFTFKEAMDG